MRITFFSNYMNHHQLYFSKELINIVGERNYYFIACMPIEQERLDMGYPDINKEYSFIIRPYENKEQYKLTQKLAIESDVMIFGSGDEEFIKLRMDSGDKLTFRYSERLFKKGTYRRFISQTFNKVKNAVLQYKNKINFYMLCASAFTSYDLSLCGFSNKRCFKWGYFPEVENYTDITKLIKKKNRHEILWCGRFLDWKHPEKAVKTAEYLKKNNVSFHMKMIGTGKEEKRIKKLIKKKNLSSDISLLGSMSPEEVRKHMESAQIFLFTSNFREGWGAVLNEAMNSGCACVVSHAIGSAPFLINNGENGLIFDNGNIMDLFTKVKLLTENILLTEKLGENAYKTLKEVWSPKIAAQNIVKLSYNILQNESKDMIVNGPCSPTAVIKNNWFMKKGDC